MPAIDKRTQQRILDMHANGETFRGISETLGVGLATIDRYVKRSYKLAPLPLPTLKLRPRDFAQLLCDRSSGVLELRADAALVKAEAAKLATGGVPVGSVLLAAVILGAWDELAEAAGVALHKAELVCALALIEEHRREGAK